MSKYIGEFTSINGIDYLIEIETEKGSNNGTFLLSGNPLQSSMDSDGKTMYAPIKCSGMTVSILTKDMPFDLYSGSVMGTKVNVKEGNRYIFKGFLTPCAYSMGFDNELEEVQLECVDGISALKEIPYSSSDKEIKPFINIIFNCLKKVNCFKTLYVTNTMQFTSSGNEAIFEKIRVSESNFFEEKDYELQPDNDVAMSCYDVLFEVMQYMGCTLVADGEDVYILDYDAIRNGKNVYFKYDISNSSIGTKQQVTLSKSYHIKEGSYAESGSKVDLSETFNKLTVKDDFYIKDEAFEGTDNARNYENVTATTDPTLMGWWTNDINDSGNYHFPTIISKDGDTYMICIINSNKNDYYFVLCKFLRNPLIETIHYNIHMNNAKMREDTLYPFRYSDMLNYRGATNLGYFVKKIDKSKYENWRRSPSIRWPIIDDTEKLRLFGQLLGMSDVTNKLPTRYILCLNQKDNGHISHDKVKDYPYFKLTKNVPTIFGGENACMILSGSLMRHSDSNYPFPEEGYSKDNKNSTIYKGESYLWAQIKWGEYYWSDVNTEWHSFDGHWETTPQYFKLWYGDPTKDVKLADWYNKEMKFYNTAKKIWGLNDADGIYIPAPPTKNLAGNIELTVFANKDTKGTKHNPTIFKKDDKNTYNAFPPYVMLFKDMKIELQFEDESLLEDEAKEDTYYTNEVEDYLNIKEGEEINCKICTHDNKTPSLSTTDYVDSNGESQYIDKLFNLATNITLRAEEHIIYKTINQYQEPRAIYTANLKNDIDFKPYMTLTDKTLSNKTFIIDTIQRDYRYNKAEVSMIEKNNRYS